MFTAMLAESDQENIDTINQITGSITKIGAIRFALEYAAHMIRHSGPEN